eukprot:7891457-Pyramimonas_sp.AAC.1
MYGVWRLLARHVPRILVQTIRKIFADSHRQRTRSTVLERLKIVRRQQLPALTRGVDVPEWYSGA